NPELDPTPQEAGGPAVALAEEDVVAAGAGEEDGDFSQGERAEECQHSAQHPDYCHPAEMRHVLRHRLRLLENARTDDRAHDDGRRDKRTECTHETGFGSSGGFTDHRLSVRRRSAERNPVSPRNRLSTEGQVA